MTKKSMETLDARSRPDWRKWLTENHDSVAEIWLVFHKRHQGVASLGDDDAVEEALCFGWIDSLVKRLDDASYARKFTPRKADSRWSTINRRRYANLESRGLIAASGLRRAPTGRSGDAPRPLASSLPSYIEKTLKTDPPAWRYFEGLSPSCRTAYIGWIESAKKDETKQKRLCAALAMLADGKKLGLK